MIKVWRALWSKMQAMKIVPKDMADPSLVFANTPPQPAKDVRVRIPRINGGGDQPSLVRNIGPAPHRVEIGIADQRDVGRLNVILLKYQDRAGIGIAPP